MPKKHWILTGGVTLLLLAATPWMKSEFHRNNLLQRSESQRRPHRTSEETQALRQSNRQFADIWMARSQRSVVAELLPFLENPDAGLRMRAVKGLGRLEDPAGKPPLEQLKLRWQDPAQREQVQQSHVAPQIAMKLALARIENRDLRGKAKLEAIARSVDLSWEEIIKLSQKVNAPRAYAAGTPAALIVREMVDVLYTMGKKGENIKPLAGQLELTRAQQIMMQGASLSTQKEAQLIVNYLSQLQIIRDDENLVRLLLANKTNSSSILRRKLLEIQTKKTHDTREGVVTLLRAAPLFDESNLLQAVKKYEKSSDSYIRSEAKSAVKKMEQHTAYPPILP